MWIWSDIQKRIKLGSFLLGVMISLLPVSLSGAVEIPQADTSMQLNFLMKEMFGLRQQNIRETQQQFDARIRDPKKLRKLRNYLGQGLYHGQRGRELELAPPVAEMAAKQEQQSILEAVKENLALRGYRKKEAASITERSVLDGKRISNQFFETGLREALNEIAEQTGVNFLMDDTVQGAVTVKFDSTPLDEALQMMFLPGGFAFKEVNGYILVGFPSVDSPTFRHLSVTETVRPAYLKPSEILDLLSPNLQNFVKVSDENNTIVVTATRELADRALHDIVVIDRKPTQIMLKAVITDLTESAKRELGVDWWSSDSSYTRSSGTTFSDQSSVAPSDVSGFNLSKIDPGRIFTNPLDNTTATLMSETFNLNFKALVNSGQARVWATPRVVTLDGKEATIEVTSDQTFNVVSGPSGSESVDTKDMSSGITLQLTPRIGLNGEISLNIGKAEIGTISRTGELQTGMPERLPVLTKRSITTTVAVKNRETLVIGGLLDKQFVESKKNIPGLEGIPGVSDTLLGSGTRSMEERDLVIFIVPTILEETDQGGKKKTFL